MTRAVTAILMAKLPRPGSVKTRLAGSGLGNEGAAEVARAMVRCLVDRLRRRFELVVAVSPDGAATVFEQSVLAGGGRDDVVFVDQGTGTLGDRMQRLWEMMWRQRRQPVVFFGMDSPDVPGPALELLIATLTTDLERRGGGCSRAVIGPSHDGGYWTIGGTAPCPALLTDIDWGQPSVYDQTCARAAEAGTKLTVLPVWPDIDTAADLIDLMRRLDSITDPGNPAATSGRENAETCEQDEARLIELARVLRPYCDMLINSRNTAATPRRTD